MLETRGVESVNVFTYKVCPVCKELGVIATDFGVRRMGNKIIAQSYCNTCRRKKEKD